jgi:hypothetical protein
MSAEKSAIGVDGAELEAGRELDALVAERVMQLGASIALESGTELWMFPYGASITETQKELGNNWFLASSIEYGSYYSDASLNTGSEAKQRILRDSLVPLKRYSTDIAAAWEVVEKLRDLGFFLDISVAVDRFDVDMRADRMPSDWWLREGPLAEATTAPLAICRAALQAITLSTNSDGDTLGSGK